MRWVNYILLCASLAVIVFLSVMYVPAVSNAIETELLSFLSTNAR